MLRFSASAASVVVLALLELASWPKRWQTSDLGYEKPMALRLSGPFGILVGSIIAAFGVDSCSFFFYKCYLQVRKEIQMKLRILLT